MTITDKQVEAALHALAGHGLLPRYTDMRAALEAAEAAVEQDTPVAWVEVKDTHRGPYEFHGIELLPEGRHELFLADQTALREVTPAAPSSAEQPDPVYVAHDGRQRIDREVLHASPGYKQQVAALKELGALMKPTPGAPDADERASWRDVVAEAVGLLDLSAHRIPVIAQARELLTKLVARAQSSAAPVSDPVAMRVRFPWSDEWIYEKTNKTAAEAQKVIDFHAKVGSVAEYLYTTHVTAPADARDAEDARRYRWLRERDVWTTAYGGVKWCMAVRRSPATEGIPFTHENNGRHLDEAIDRAMGAEGGEG